MKRNRILLLCVSLGFLLLLTVLSACRQDDGKTDGIDTKTETAPSVTDAITTLDGSSETDLSSDDTISRETVAEPPTETTEGTADETETEAVDTEASTAHIDMIAWYDIDNGASCNSRPHNGWFYLYPDTPGVATQKGQYTSATSLLGTYDQVEEATARQHLYWLAAAGFDAVACDLTNYKSYQNETSADFHRYCLGVYNNTENLLRTATAMEDSAEFKVPDVYVTVRLQGKEFDALRAVLDEVYTLYSKYPEKVYHFNGSDKPFVVIFADQSVMADVAATFDDARFDIRFSNGFLDSMTKTDSNGAKYLTTRQKLWLFIENTKAAKEGYYTDYYIRGTDRAEMMTAWVSVWNGWDGTGTGWGDALNSTYDGLSVIERTTIHVEMLRPQALLVNRFNYARAWLEEPQEGIGLYESGHFEPCEELGFTVFNQVLTRLNSLNFVEATAPRAPVMLSADENRLYLSTRDFPTEVRMATTEDMSGSEWVYFDYANGLDYSRFLSDEGKATVYIQTRNAYGESSISMLEVENTARSYTVPGSVIYENDLNNWTAADLSAHFVLDGTFTRENGMLCGTWGDGRALRYVGKNDLRYPQIELQMLAGDHVESGACYKSAIALRLPFDRSIGDLKLYEPDNGDADKSSYLGVTGIYLYTFGNTLEVSVHVEDDQRQLGVSSVVVPFTLPDGVSFKTGATVRVDDLGDTIRVYVNDHLLATVRLSGLEEVTNIYWSGFGYRNAEITDTSGKVLATAEHCLVPATGNFAVVERVNTFKIDSVKILQIPYVFDGRDYIVNREEA